MVTVLPFELSNVELRAPPPDREDGFSGGYRDPLKMSFFQIWASDTVFFDKLRSFPVFGLWNVPYNDYVTIIKHNIL